VASYIVTKSLPTVKGMPGISAGADKDN